MKIIHFMGECPYIDNWGYQENILPEYHQLKGHEVVVIASNIYPSYYSPAKEHLKKTNEYLNNDVKVRRIEADIDFFTHRLIYKNLTNILEEEKPDLIYIHGLVTLNLSEISKFVRKHSTCKLFADTHADYHNSARNWISRLLLYKIIWRRIISKNLDIIDKIYAITPGVEEFARELYEIPESKLKLLPLGGDIRYIDIKNKKLIRDKIRELYSIDTNDIVIITGGKLDKHKRTYELIEVVKQLNLSNVILIVIGKAEEEYEVVLKQVLNNVSRIYFTGWLSSKQIYEHYLASDIACFPGTQSVLWQQAICCGLPLVCKYWPGAEYLDVGGNLLFIFTDSLLELKQAVSQIICVPEVRERMSNIAISKGKEIFDYNKISDSIIDDYNDLI